MSFIESLQRTIRGKDGVIAELREEVANEKVDAAAARECVIMQIGQIRKLEAQLAAYRWIPVGERLPESGPSCIITNGTWFEKIWYDSDSYDGWCWQNGLPFRWASQITHWMPIPLLPKGAKP